MDKWFIKTKNVDIFEAQILSQIEILVSIMDPKFKFSVLAIDWNQNLIFWEVYLKFIKIKMLAPQNCL